MNSFTEAAQKIRQEGSDTQVDEEEHEDQDTEHTGGSDLDPTVTAQQLSQDGVSLFPFYHVHNPWMSAPHFPTPGFNPMYWMDSKGPAPSQPDYKTRYDAIKSSVSRVVLDQDWIAPDSRMGIASADRELAAILARVGKFVETELKLISQIQASYQDEMKVAEYIDQLHVVQKAHMRYIQEEYNSLQLGGQYGSQAKSMFKQIRQNTTVYTPAFVDDIKTVLNVTGAIRPQPSANPSRF